MMEALFVLTIVVLLFLAVSMISLVLTGKNIDAVDRTVRFVFFLFFCLAAYLMWLGGNAYTADMQGNEIVAPHQVQGGGE